MNSNSLFHSEEAVIKDRFFNLDWIDTAKKTERTISGFSELKPQKKRGTVRFLKTTHSSQCPLAARKRSTTSSGDLSICGASAESSKSSLLSSNQG